MPTVMDFIKDWTQSNIAALKAVGWAFLQKKSVKIPLNRALKYDSNYVKHL
jgi:hypothetical protein